MKAALTAAALAAGLCALAATAVAAVPPDPVPGKDDTCGAGAYQYLVGKPKSDIPPKPQGAIWRVVSNKQMVTMDYIEARLDIIWDSETKRVIRVKCG